MNHAGHDPYEIGGGARPSVGLAGAPVDLVRLDDAIGLVVQRARARSGPPLGVVSANLDHVHHFGRGGRWQGVMDPPAPDGPGVEWLTLLDGAPLVRQAGRATGKTWPRLAGSDLTAPLLSAAAANRLRIGFVGGMPETQAQVREVLRRDHPQLPPASFWAPERDELADRSAMLALAGEVRRAGVDVLFVCMGKPRQEVWIREYGPLSGAPVMLAFGAAVDFIAERVVRAPATVASWGFEWLWRLAHEPRRLAQRYLVEGPVAYARMRTRTEVPARLPVVPHSRPDGYSRERILALQVPGMPITRTGRRGRRRSAVVPARDRIARVRDQLADLDALLLLPAGTTIDDAGMEEMLRRLAVPGVGAVVPRVLGASGEVRHVLLLDGGVPGIVADTFLGRHRLPNRPPWMSRRDQSAEGNAYPHAVAGVESGALLVSGEAAAALLDEPRGAGRVLLSRVHASALRARGLSVWFEPAAQAVADVG